MSKSFFLFSYFAFYAVMLVLTQHPTIFIIPAFVASCIAIATMHGEVKGARAIEAGLCFATYAGICAFSMHQEHYVIAVGHFPTAVAYFVSLMNALPIGFSISKKHERLLSAIGYYGPILSDPPYVFAAAIATAELLEGELK